MSEIDEDRNDTDSDSSHEEMHQDRPSESLSFDHMRSMEDSRAQPRTENISLLSDDMHASQKKDGETSSDDSSNVSMSCKTRLSLIDPDHASSQASFYESEVSTGGTSSADEFYGFEDTLNRDDSHSAQNQLSNRRPFRSMRIVIDSDEE